MPELPDIEVYVRAIGSRMTGRPLTRVRTGNPFVLRTAAPPAGDLAGRTVTGVRRLGKRVVLCLEGERFAAIHLMISGRLHWRPSGTGLAGRAALAAFDTAEGSLVLTEHSTRKRASVHLLAGEAALGDLDAGGLELAGSTAAGFGRALRAENHTLKRALTDPRLVSGIGNAYSDEILHRAQMSPFKLTQGMAEEEIARLHAAATSLLAEWTARLMLAAGDGFPEGVTAYRPEMAVHGRHGRPCPACGDAVQRIVYAESEANYCATCQTGGRLLADRALSRLLREDWPRSPAELEEHFAARRPVARGEEERDGGA